MTEISALVKEYKEMLKNGEDIPIEVSRRFQLAISIDTHDEVMKINGRLKKVEAATDEYGSQPSLLSLLHTNPKKTTVFIATILILTFLLLEVTWEYGLFPKLIEWFGLPPLIP